MKVVLREDVESLGRKGDLLDMVHLSRRQECLRCRIAVGEQRGGARKAPRHRREAVGQILGRAEASGRLGLDHPVQQIAGGGADAHPLGRNILEQLQQPLLAALRRQPLPAPSVFFGLQERRRD